MSAIRLYIDEDAMHTGLIDGLRARNIDVLTVVEANFTGRDDDVQLAFAAGQQRSMYSFNVGDFCRLHTEYMQSGRSHGGIILVPRQRYGVGEQLRRLFDLVDATPAEQMNDALVFL